LQLKFVPSIVTAQSASLTQARRRALLAYRDWIRASPHIVELYQLDITTSALKRRVRQAYEESRHVSDLGVIDVMLLKSRQELEETLNFWKQKTHVMRYFEQNPYAEPKPRDFLGKFYEGR
ncbi:hypothetical protein DFJ73DRAFT_881413, partial [Zopfochytrium polystomum]